VCEEAVELLVAGVFQGPSSTPPPASRISGEQMQNYSKRALRFLLFLSFSSFGVACCVMLVTAAQ
jgi:hypothetical protein